MAEREDSDAGHVDADASEKPKVEAREHEEHGEEVGIDSKPKDSTDAEIEAMRARVKQMEDEAKKIEAMQKQVEAAVQGPDSADADNKSIYVGNVDYSTTPEELKEFFSSCGPVTRVTILCDKWTGHPKGFGYLEFEDADSISNAVLLNGTEFKGRQLKVNAKRRNLPGFGHRRRRSRRRRRRRRYHPYY